MILSGENVAGGPGNLSTEGNEGLDENSGLNGCLRGSEKNSSYVVCISTERTHVQATSDTGTLEGLVGTVLLTDGHETGHLNLGELNLPATEGSQGLER